MFSNYFDKIGMAATFNGKEDTRKKSQRSMLKYLKNRYDNDPEYRELQLQKSRDRYKQKKEAKEKEPKKAVKEEEPTDKKKSHKSTLEYLKNRYENDPEYRELQLQKSRDKYKQKKEAKEKAKKEALTA